MSTRGEGDLRDKLGMVLDSYAPGPLPYQVVVNKGRQLAIRRRLTTAAILAIVAAVAAILPATLTTSQARRPVAAPRYHVTVYPPASGARHGLIASGTVGRWHWHLAVTAERDLGQTSICYHAVSDITGCDDGIPRASAEGSPASLTGDPGSDGTTVLAGTANQLLYGTVRSDVAYLRVRLSNGQLLTLHPVPVFGQRYASYVAIAVPQSTAVTAIIAYSDTGELAYTVPFTAAGWIEITHWLKPGRPASRSVTTYQLGSGILQGTRWTATAYVGAWGTCFASTVFELDVCNPGFGQLRHGVLVVNRGSYGNGSRSGTLVQTAPQVSYLILRANGATIRLPAVEVNSRKYCLYASDSYVETRGSWTAYDAAGGIIGTGSATGW